MVAGLYMLWAGGAETVPHEQRMAFPGLASELKT